MPLVGLNSRMKGVPIADPAHKLDYDRLDEYESGQTEEFRVHHREARDFLKSLTR
jgi:hypothetical protein